jgi:hypothetical protein
MTNDEIIISPDLSPLYTNPRCAFGMFPSRQNFASFFPPK